MLYLLATPIGNIADITIRALEILESCKIILCEDTRVASKLISLLQSRNLLSHNDFTYISFHSHNEDSRLKEFNTAFFHNDVVFMSDAGMPCVSDPGAKLVKFMQDNHLPYTILPGVSSVCSAFALSGFEDKGYRFVGFLPHKKQEKISILSGICQSSEICICFESTHRILETINMIAQIAPEIRLFVAKEMTKMYERLFVGSALEIKNSINDVNISGEWVIVLQGSGKLAPTLGLNDIVALEIPPKVKAKLIAKLTNKSVDECYNAMLDKGVK